MTADSGIAIDAIAAYKLESLGVVQLKGNLAEPSCAMYRLYFREQLEQVCPHLNEDLHEPHQSVQPTHWEDIN